VWQDNHSDEEQIHPLISFVNFVEFVNSKNLVVVRDEDQHHRCRHEDQEGHRVALHNPDKRLETRCIGHFFHDIFCRVGFFNVEREFDPSDEFPCSLPQRISQIGKVDSSHHRHEELEIKRSYELEEGLSSHADHELHQDQR